MKRALAVLLAIASLLEAGGNGNRVQYIGGTVPGIKLRSDVNLDLLGDERLQLRSRELLLEIDWRDIHTIEYGQRVNRRYVEAALLSPVFLLGKRRSHFLTIGYTDAGGAKQAMVLEVGKNDIRPILVSLEARTGRRIEYQDDEARKAGRG